MFNQIVLVGTVKKDADLRYTPNDSTPVIDFVVIVTERWVGRDNDTPQERTTRFRVTAWRKVAEDSAPYLVEGRRIMVMGRFAGVSAWMDEDGDPYARMDVTARRIVPVMDEADDQEFQQVMAIGNLGRDPELRYTPDGTAVTDFSLAVNERWSDRESGEWKEKTLWFRVSVWRRQAETVAQYLSKGRKALVIGRMTPPSAYIGRGGEARGSLEVTATNIRFLGGRGDDTAISPSSGANTPTTYAGPPTDDGDEIPF